jgi:hypothetical protein
MTYPKVFKEWCLHKAMELMIKHSIYALDGLIVAQRSLDGPGGLMNNAQNGYC